MRRPEYNNWFESARKERLKEFKLLAKKLNKKQLRRLARAEDKYIKKMKTLIDRWGPMFGFKIEVKSEDLVTLQWKINYVKYTLLRMKYPKAEKSENRPNFREGDNMTEYQRMVYSDQQERYQGCGPGGMT